MIDKRHYIGAFGIPTIRYEEGVPSRLFTIVETSRGQQARRAAKADRRAGWTLPGTQGRTFP